MRVRTTTTMTMATTTTTDQIKALGFARIAVGASLLLMPSRGGRTWIGPSAADAPVKVALRAMAIRDLAIGLGAVIAVDRDAPARGWIEAGALSDAGDLAATLLAWRQLPKFGRLVAAGMAAAGMIGGIRLAGALD